MKLIRNTTPTGLGKYALIRLDKMRQEHILPLEYLIENLNIEPIFVELGRVGDKEEFFVLKLKDQYAKEALEAYAKVALAHGDKELHDEVMQLASRSGHASPYNKIPD